MREGHDLDDLPLRLDDVSASLCDFHLSLWSEEIRDCNGGDRAEEHASEETEIQVIRNVRSVSRHLHSASFLTARQEELIS